jgi:hypothetical protein
MMLALNRSYGHYLVVDIEKPWTTITMQNIRHLFRREDNNDSAKGQDDTGNT